VTLAVTTDQLLIWFFIILLALIADVGAFLWLRRLWQRQGQTLAGQIAQAWQRLKPRLILSRLSTGLRRSAATVHGPPLLPVRPEAPHFVSLSVSPSSTKPPDAQPQLTKSVTVMSTSEQATQATPGPAAETLRPTSAESGLVTVLPTSHDMARITLEVPVGTAIRVTVETWPDTGTGLPPPQVTVQTVEATGLGQAGPPARPIQPTRPRPAGLATLGARGQALLAFIRTRVTSIEALLFGSALGVYLVTHLIGLERFPIYFFTDEAVHMNFASAFVHNGLKNYEREFLPTYFSLGSAFGLNSVSVYVQVLPYVLFGKSVLVTRAVSMFIAALGAAWVSLSLKHAFKIKPYWLGALLISVSPAWFLHARTAFEYIEVAAFYAGFIYFYLRYRTDQPQALYGAVVLGALTFYTHGLGQLLMGLTGLALLLSDLPYHWHPARRPIILRALVLALVLALPYIRYATTHPSATLEQLRQRGSYWTNLNLTLPDKLLSFAKEYTYGLSPTFWYFPNGRDLIRHVMKGYGHLLWPTLPFALIGLGVCLRRFRSGVYRVLLIVLLVSPVPSAMVAIGITRILWFMVPATLITALGLAQVMEILSDPTRFLAGFRGSWPKAWRFPPTLISASVFVALAGFNVFMLRDALVNGPRWYTDYTLYGMQYGAKQVFGELVPTLLERDPPARIFVSPSWANGTDQFLPFFLEDPAQLARVQIRTVEEYLFQRTALDPANLFVMMPAEYTLAVNSPKFKPFAIDTTLFYPDGSTAFYVARLEYADNLDAIFTEEAAERRKPVEGQTMIDGQLVTARYSRLGSGDLIHIFDGDPFTLVRGLEANPFVIELTFPEPRSVSGLAGDFGSMDFSLTVLLYPDGSEMPLPYAQPFTQNKPDPHVEMAFTDAPAQVSRLRLEVKHLSSGATGQIHIRELKFLP